MIVCGYPCIGKSTVAKQNPLYIDLESSNFKTKGYDNPVWYEGYCKLAVELHRTGHVVFTSTHPDVVMNLTASATLYSSDGSV